MTITVPGMRSNKLVSMDIDQLRGWAAFMDRAMIVSLIATIMAVAALGITTWLSFRYSGAVRAHEHALVDRYKGMESHSVQVEQDVAAARERAAALEQEVSTARGRAVALEQEASTARERAVAFEQAAREATEQAARAARESAADSEKARTPRFDAAEIKQRLADLGKLVREATARAVDPTQGNATETPRRVQGEVTPGSAAVSRDGQPSPIVSSLRKYAGTKAAVFVIDQISDAPVTGSTISAYLSDAGWAPQTWKWTGVAGIFGVVVLIKEGSDPRRLRPRPPSWRPLRSTGFNGRRETGRRTGAGSAAHSTVRKRQARRKLLSGSSSGQSRVDSPIEGAGNAPATIASLCRDLGQRDLSFRAGILGLQEVRHSVRPGLDAVLLQQERRLAAMTGGVHRDV
jgi:Zn-ribbon protein, possibly nucleic acid-binding